METTGIVLPGDDAVRSDVPVQWWYWTGHLEARDGRRFGFEQCFFVIDAAADFFGSALDDEFLRDALSRDVEGFQVAHCALTDVAGQVVARPHKVTGAQDHPDQQCDDPCQTSDVRAAFDQ